MKHSMFSRIEKSWNILQPDLSPNDEDVVAVFGNDPISACQPVIDLNRRFFPGNDWQVKNEIIIQAAQQVNVANVAPTVIGSSDIFHFFPRHNSDYIIRAGQKISIYPGFRINVQTIHPITGVLDFHDGNQNRVSFQISPCTPFIDDCGFNHENAMVIPHDNKGYMNDASSKKTLEYFSLNFSIYPNPTNGASELKLTSENGIKEIKIMDVFGKVVYNSQPNQDENSQLKISLDGLSQGVYFISVVAFDGQSKTQKFVIN